MRLYELFLWEFVWVKWMNSNVTNFITTSKLRSIRTNSDTSNWVDNIHYIGNAIILMLDGCAILISILGISFKVVVRGLRFFFFSLIRLWLAQSTCNENHLTHIFTVGIFCKALIYFLEFSRTHCGVYKVPESNGTIWGASHKLGQVVLIFSTGSWNRFLIKSNLVLVWYSLYVMDRSTVWIHTPQHRHRF